MSSGFTAGVLTLFVPIFLFAASCANSGDDKTEKETQKRYLSPKAVRGDTGSAKKNVSYFCWCAHLLQENESAKSSTIICAQKYQHDTLYTRTEHEIIPQII